MPTLLHLKIFLEENLLLPLLVFFRPEAPVEADRIVKEHTGFFWNKHSFDNKRLLFIMKWAEKKVLITHCDTLFVYKTDRSFNTKVA